MNKFVKGAKNLAFGLSFVSVCACGGVENVDLNAVNKEFGHGGSKKNDNGNNSDVSRGNVNNDDRENVRRNVNNGVRRNVRRNVNHGVRRNVDNGNRESEKLIIKQGIVKSCIKENEINFDLLNKLRLDLSGCNFFVSKDNKILFDEKEVFDFSNLGTEIVNFIRMIIHINEYKGVLQFEEGFEKIKVKVGDNMFIFNGVKFNSVEGCVRFVCILGLIDREVFNKLFVCDEWKISNGNINNKTFNLFGEKLFNSILMSNVDSDELLNMKYFAFLNGFSFLFGGEKCKIVRCYASNDDQVIRVDVEVGDKGIVFLS